MEVDAQRGRIVAERLTDQARVIFDGDYLREHITLGYAGTVHSAQGMTIGTSTQPGMCWTILSDRASRAMGRGWQATQPDPVAPRPKPLLTAFGVCARKPLKRNA
jgi:hypothetical protein